MAGSESSGKQPSLAARMLQGIGKGRAAGATSPATPKKKPKEALAQLAAAAARWEQNSLGIAPEGYMLLDDVRKYRRLRKGAQGHAVTALQRALQKSAGLTAELSGTFDEETDRCVRAFQAKHGAASEDGVVGYLTMTALDKVLGLAPRERHGAPIAEGRIPETGNAFIDSIAEAAIQAHKASGIFASILLAVAVMESGWGESADARELNNPYGVRETDEGLVPAAGRGGAEPPADSRPKRYDSPVEAVHEFAALFRQTTGSSLGGAHTPDRLAHAMSGTFSPDRNYGKTMIRIMLQFDLYRFDSIRDVEA